MKGRDVYRLTWRTTAGVAIVLLTVSVAGGAATGSSLGSSATPDGSALRAEGVAGAATRGGAAPEGSLGPDVTVINLTATDNYGAVGGIRAYSVGTTSCNVGDQPVWWCDVSTSYCDDAQHPVIAQNLYRLKNGRFEQLGMSWLKHGFLSTNSDNADCGSVLCDDPPHGGDQLGIGCTDTYGPFLNGNTPLGERSEVNATTGVFPYPYTVVQTSTNIDQRLQVEESDVDPAQNPGALYWVEGQYVTNDDAVAGNGLNNASYRRVTVSGSSFDLDVTGSTFREQSAIYAWQANDPDVELVNADVPGSSPLERFEAGLTVGGAVEGASVHYEIAIHNLNSDRSANAFTVQFPGPANFLNAGFRDVDHHSGEPYQTTDWDITTTSNSITWSTDDFATDELANALRWGTMFSFWFDSDQAPSGASYTLSLFKPGSPATVQVPFQGGSLVFLDGFETGDTSRWDATVE